MTALPVLDIENLQVAFGAHRALEGISLHVGRGEILGLVGASGSGKSVTAAAIMRLLPESAQVSGSLRLHGKDLAALSGTAMRRVRGRDIGMIFQDPLSALNPLLQVGVQIEETLYLHAKLATDERRQQVRAMLARVGLAADTDIERRYPSELSGGQRQRIGIAMAAILTPALLIADEPTTALDVITQQQVLALLKQLVRERGMALILVTHDMAVMAEMADRVAVMQAGRIVEQGTTTALLHHAEHPYTRALLAAAAPTPAAVRSERATTPVVLEGRHLTRSYPGRRRSLWQRQTVRRAVDDVSLTVHAGETVALVGESGSGKSSLLRMLLALDPAQAGEVRLLGQPFSIEVPAPARRAMQAVFQDPYGSFDPRWTVARLVAEPFHLLAPLSAGERHDKVVAALEQVGLAAADAERYPREFSGGQRQRIAIARALVTEPKVIVLDEALSALDVLLRAQVLELLAALSRRLGLAYLFVSHDLGVVANIADRIYVMQRGQIVEQGETAQVFGAPQHPYTQALLAATPRL